MVSVLLFAVLLHFSRQCDGIPTNRVLELEGFEDNTPVRRPFTTHDFEGKYSRFMELSKSGHLCPKTLEVLSNGVILNGSVEIPHQNIALNNKKCNPKGSLIFRFGKKLPINTIEKRFRLSTQSRGIEAIIRNILMHVSEFYYGVEKNGVRCGGVSLFAGTVILFTSDSDVFGDELRIPFRGHPRIALWRDDQKSCAYNGTWITKTLAKDSNATGVKEVPKSIPATSAPETISPVIMTPEPIGLLANATPVSTPDAQSIAEATPLVTPQIEITASATPKATMKVTEGEDGEATVGISEAPSTAEATPLVTPQIEITASATPKETMEVAEGEGREATVGNSPLPEASELTVSEGSGSSVFVSVVPSPASMGVEPFTTVPGSIPVYLSGPTVEPSIEYSAIDANQGDLRETPVAPFGSTETSTPSPSELMISESNSPADASFISGGEVPTPNPSRSVEPETQSSNDGSTCFPANALAKLNSGTLVRMDNLRVGDLVHVGDGLVSPVIGFSHADHSVLTRFVNFTTESGRTISATRTHFMYTSRGLVAAGQIGTGDFLRLEDGTDTKVVNAEGILARGLFNPHTVQGNIVVDGFVTSTYTAAVEPGTAHALLAPIRILETLGVHSSIVSYLSSTPWIISNARSVINTYQQ